MGQPRRSFTPEFKQNAVDLCRRSGKCECQVARELGMSPTDVQSVDAASRGGTQPLPGDRGAQGVAAGSEQLRMERDILKKGAW